jgi:hypothetical protein
MAISQRTIFYSLIGDSQSTPNTAVLFCLFARDAIQDLKHARQSLYH